MKEYEQKTIYCPKCGRKAGVWDGRSTMNWIMRCKKCHKRVIYKVETGEVLLKPLPPRKCGSGMTFC